MLKPPVVGLHTDKGPKLRRLLITHTHTHWDVSELERPPKFCFGIYRPQSPPTFTRHFSQRISSVNSFRRQWPPSPLSAMRDSAIPRILPRLPRLGAVQKEGRGRPERNQGPWPKREVLRRQQIEEDHPACGIARLASGKFVRKEHTEGATVWGLKHVSLSVCYLYGIMPRTISHCPLDVVQADSQKVSGLS